MIANAFLDSLTSADRRAENIGIEAIIVAELKLGNVERHVFGRHLVQRADNATLEDRPETFNHGCHSVARINAAGERKKRY